MKNTKRFASIDDIKPLDVKDYYAFDCANAVDIIRKAIDDKKSFHIRGDYDNDGISSIAILILALTSLGANVEGRAPLRLSEGFGLSVSMIDEIEDGVVITVDNGIVAFDAAKKAKEKGLDLIITDHHLPKIDCAGTIILPEADCILNPHIQEIKGEPGFDFYDYCGAGIALKLSESLLGSDHPLMNKLYALAAIATVADVMPLIEDNRRIFIRGCEAMRQGDITDGLYQLLFLNKIEVNNLPVDIPAYLAITSETVGFKISPCINAASRLKDDGAKIALNCMLCDGDNAKARTVATELYELNEERKNLTSQEIAHIEAMLSEAGRLNDCPIVVYSPESLPGLIGLDSGKLCESRGVPAIVICGKDDRCKGSCRAPDGVNMKALLDAVADKLVQYGGHSGAAGLTIKEEDIDSFRESLISLCKAKGITRKTPDELYYDLSIKSSDISDTLDKVTYMAPFGECNPEPVFMITEFNPEDIRVLGGKHIKLTSQGITAIGFNMLDGEGVEIPGTVSILGTLGYNIFRGAATPQITIKAIYSSSGDELYKSKENIN